MHPDEDLFEEYSFDRLSEQETVIFEEHLLMCQECRKTFATAEEYIGLMKGASLAYAACVAGRHNSTAPLKRGASGDNHI